MKQDESLFLYLNKELKIAIIYNLNNSKQYMMPYDKAVEMNSETIQKINALKCDPEEPKFQKLEHLRFVVTNRCNLKCIYCYADGGSYHQDLQDMSFDTIKKTIEFFYARYKWIHQISFFGGEPLIKTDLIEKSCNYINSFCIQNSRKFPIYSMVTNATLMNESAIKLINKYNILVNISLDGPKEFNDRQRVFVNSKGSVFDIVDQNVKELRKLNNFSIESTCSNIIFEYGYTFEDIKNYFMKRYNISRVNVSGAMIVDNVDNKLGILDKDSVGDSMTAEVEKFFSNNDFIFNDVIIRLLNTFYSKYYCSTFCDAGITQFTVSMNGDVYPCQLFIGKEDYKLGNVTSLDEELLKEFKQHQLKNFDKCKKCGYLRFCQTCLRRRNEIKCSESYCADLKKAIRIFLKKMFDLKFAYPLKYNELLKGYKQFYEKNR